MSKGKLKKLARKEQNERASQARALVEAARLNPDALAPLPAFRHFSAQPHTFELTYLHPGQLTAAAKVELFSLLKSNMEQLYNTAWGWNDDEKRDELFHEEARYLVARSDGALAGYCHIRYIDDDAIAAAYLYEIQVSPWAQGKGLGKMMMQTTELIARRAKMEKVGLTVFTANTGALRFYKDKMGYRKNEAESPKPTPDGKSPTFEVLEKIFPPPTKVN